MVRSADHAELHLKPGFNQTREAHKPAKPTNSWGAPRSMIQQHGSLRGPCRITSEAGFQPNARSAQTGVADKLMVRSAVHDPTAWFAPRTMHTVMSLPDPTSAGPLPPQLRVRCLPLGCSCPGAFYP